MLKDITIGQYYPTSSAIHKLDPRIKLVATIVFMVSIFVVNKFWPYIVVLLCLLAMIKLANIPVKYIVKGVKPLKWIILFTFLINIFFLPGDEIWSFGFLAITKQGLRQAIFMAIRLIFLVVGTSLLTLQLHQ
ncbi:cobalt transport family protein [Clostridioides difficile DA00134]|uniref:energy-coupling factor transporter transmembrane component T family protein n=1 Tax=Clostridioides difficile TaxID=1496 RepID=UPI00038C871D|nr:energy-coupling factor transporter transmembrane component T [Clostridioides difficile]EQG51167.1 cobalt transport family protein [Clostridioides difficile DA00134]